ncbi:MAG: protein translocase subunit SecF [Acidimicrobiales bacterium]
MFAKLYRGDADIDFRKWWPRAMVLSLLLVAISIGSFAVRGLNLGIDFEGGGVWEVPDENSSVADVRAALPAGKQDAKIQVVTGTEGRRIRVQSDLEELGPESESVTLALAEQAGVDPNEVSVESVGPSWGDEITKEARKALVVFFALIALYITIQLEWKMAVGALVAVAHDIIISVGVYSIFQFEVTPATAIAFLTIMGYSLYDTIVVYDKVRVNEARLGHRGRMTYADLMSMSMNQVLMRSINTSLTSLIPVGSLLFVGSFAFGAETLREFALALFIGIALGTYSSIFVAAPIVVLLKEREPHYREAKERAKRAGDADTMARSVGDDATTEVISSSGTIIQPKARKKRRH